MSTQKKFSAFFATLIELPFRKTDFNKRLRVIFNGEENDYPERVSRLIPNSITARQCKKLFRQFLTGRGYEGQNDVIVNKKKKIKLIHFINAGNDEYAEQAGIAVHVQYKADGSKDRVEVIDFCSVRKGKKDDKDYSGMIAVSTLGHFNGVNAKQLIWCYAYNPDPEVVKSQIEKSKGLAKYPGQIFIFNPTRYDYPLAHLHPVLNDADSEMRASVYKNKSLRKGFFGKNIFVTSPMVNPDLSMVSRDTLSPEQGKQLKHQEKVRDDFYENAKGFVGVENNEGVMFLELEHEGDMDKVFKHIEVPTNIDDKMFSYTESSTANNIRKAYNNVPNILVDTSVNRSLFADSGAMLLQAKIFYQNQTEEDRLMLENFYKEVFEGLLEFNPEAFVPLVEVPTPEPIVEPEENEE